MSSDAPPCYLEHVPSRPVRPCLTLAFWRDPGRSSDPETGESGEATIERLGENTDTSGMGVKARHMLWLMSNGERVPPTWAIPVGAPVDASMAALDAAGPFAVRSSANVEDSADSSYAGQFVTELDVDREDVPAAIERVRQSATAERVTAYREHLGAETEVAMGVLVQTMIRPIASGVAFSRNPMTGLNEVVVEAVTGRGDLLVDQGVTPDRWVRRWGSWTESPDAGAISDDLATRVVDDTMRIAEAYGSPVDLEWVWDGSDVWWVQLRPITGLGEVGIYSNRISKEVMPGIIKPLVWSVNVPMVNRAWVDLFTEAIGRNDIEPESLAKAFAYRSYFNMGAIGDIFELLGMPRDSLENLLGLPAGEDKPSFKPTLGTIRKMPRMLAMAAGKSRYRRKVGSEVDALNSAYEPYATVDLAARSDDELLSDIDELTTLGVRAAYANIVTPLLANLYNGLLRRRLSKAGLDPESVDIADTGALVDVNPNPHLDAMAVKVADLDEATITAVREHGYDALPAALKGDVDRFLGRFGHLSASGNDFSVAPWRETPDAVAAMVVDHAATTGASTRTPWSEARATLGAASRPIAGVLRNRTKDYVAHRESVSFTYTYGYGLFRRYFTEIGRRLVERDVLGATDDVMYLYLAELRATVRGESLEVAPQALVSARRDEMAQLADVAMPEVIYGDDFVPTKAVQGEGTLTGIPTSRGHYRGTLRIVRDTSDFSNVKAGDVIAIPYSDVGWTPLFARAGAVVAEAGGMLSHSSIVAREYRIPCVVSVDGALRLPDGATVAVDGYAGTVVVEDGSVTRET